MPDRRAESTENEVLALEGRPLILSPFLRLASTPTWSHMESARSVDNTTCGGQREVRHNILLPPLKASDIKLL